MARRALGGDYVLVHNGIEVERFAKATPWPASGPTIFFLGRHEPRKGLSVLLDAMARLPDDVRLWVGGEGPETDALRRRTRGDDRVEWLGSVNEEDKARRLRGADVFCAPSLYGESFGVVLLEAMAAHVPIVATDLPGYANVARGGKDAVLVPEGDPEALAAALRSVLSDSRLAESLAGAGELRAGEFAMDRLAERYVELYAQVAARAVRS
jgi:phosphatidylinositol alpha-mannosyltransferase